MNCICRPPRTISVRIVLLDDTDFTYELRSDLPGQALLDVVFARLDLNETAYFGLRYMDEDNQTHWLDPLHRLSRQLTKKCEQELYFGVKFYATDPCKLEEEITRYHLFLQVKQDVLQRRLPVSFELASELGALVVQSELGDYDPRRHTKGYVSEFRLVANQTVELESRVSELHQQLKGMSPATAEFNYLDKVKWHDMYGVDLHPVLGEDSVEYFLGLTPSGILVLRNKTIVAHYYWSRVAKAYFKGRYFMVKVRDKNKEINTYGFETPNKSACKHLWRCCVEHQTFYRMLRAAPVLDSSSITSTFRSRNHSIESDLSKTSTVFKRIPSKKQARRTSYDNLDMEISRKTKGIQELKTISLLYPGRTFDEPYRSLASLPTVLGINSYNNNNNSNISTPDSPRSTRSAPWPRSKQRGLFGNPPSPRSVRSASTTTTKKHNVHHHHHHNHHHSQSHTPSAGGNRYRSSSVESHSSTDSRSTRRHRNRHRHRTSDNESELSRGSGLSSRSQNSHRRYRKSRVRKDSGSENDSVRGRSLSGYRLSSGSLELIDSTNQWKEVQRRRADCSSQNSVQKASVSKSSAITRTHGDNNSDKVSSNHKGKKHRKGRIWSSELARHLQFDLVDTTGMTEDQLREIPYTVVETAVAKKSGGSNQKLHKKNSIGSQGKDRVDYIRGLYFQRANVSSSENAISGSTRSVSTMSSRECSDLSRHMTSVSIADLASPRATSLSPFDYPGLRVSHEHTDSGLGAEQDYAYSSERSSDSTRYGTNKSSGASSGSHYRLGHYGRNQQQTQLSSQQQQQQQNPVSSRKPPICPNRHQYQQCFTKSSSSSSVPINNYANINCKHIIPPANNINSSNNQNSSVPYYTPSSYTPDTFNNIFPSETIIPSPYSYISPYSDNDPIRVVRRAKSDIGVPIQRHNSSRALIKNNMYPDHKSQLSSIKSDLVLSYVNTFDNNFQSQPPSTISNSSNDVYGGDMNRYYPQQQQQQYTPPRGLSSLNDLRSMIGGVGGGSVGCGSVVGNICNGNNKSTKFNNCLHYIGEKPTQSNLQTIMETKSKNPSSNCDFTVTATPGTALTKTTTTKDFIPNSNRTASSMMMTTGPLVYLEKMNNLYNTPASDRIPPPLSTSQLHGKPTNNEILKYNQQHHQQSHQQHQQNMMHRIPENMTKRSSSLELILTPILQSSQGTNTRMLEK